MLNYNYVLTIDKGRQNEMTTTQATVTQIGEQALGHADPIVVLFGEEATAEIAAIAVIQRFADPAQQRALTVAVGDTIQVGAAAYTITYVGRAAQNNLRSLGHVAFVFSDTAQGDRLQNGLYLHPIADAPRFPDFQVGTTISYAHHA
jgi:PTS system glucitol/sorbitol-specific IIA component